MSIIYDALKKVEESNNATSAVKAGKIDRPGRRVFLIYISVVCLGIFIASVFFGLFTKPPQSGTKLLSKGEPQMDKIQDVLKDSSDATAQPPEPKKHLAIPLVLNGIFFSGNEGYALINNQIVREGDTVTEGIMVKRIAMDEVELESEGSIVKLYPDR